ncbi:actin-binding protein IPP-like [Liolophura sinensis]|uniref:actin-binding protein IPP-like n=1 Tax=Liolophura sinensis TaxID=3198878 RepID=UPI003158D84F
MSADTVTFSPVHYGSTLLASLSDLLTEGVFTDVTLVVECSEFKAHRIILSACSRYFRAMFVGQLSEVSKEEVGIHGVRSEIFREILRFIYTGTVDITAENCVDLLEAADMLEVSDVVEGCSDFLKQNLTDDNCIGIYLLADAHGCIPLKTAAETYIHSHFVKVCHCKEFKRLPKDVLIHLLHSEHLHIDTEFQVFASAMDWIMHDLAMRRKCVFEVMSPIRFPLISQSQIDKHIDDCQDLSLKIALKKLVQDFQLSRKLCLELKLNKLKPYVMHPRKSARKSLIVIGGYSRPKDGRWCDSRTLKTVEMFDLFSQQWKSLPSMHYARSGHGVAELNGQIYVIGGENNSLIYDSTDCYDPVTNEWYEGPPMILPRTGMGVCSLNGCMYALGGWVGSEIGDTVEKFDPSINQWQGVGRVITPRFSMTALAYEGLIYTLGGMNDMGIELKTVESYNPVTHEWSKLASLSNCRAYIGAAVLDGHIYAVGGRNDHDGTLATVEKYSIEQNCWEEIQPMSVPRAGASVCAINGILYVVGGRSSSSEFTAPATLSSVECYDPQTGTWLDICDMPTSRCEGAVVVV